MDRSSGASLNALLLLTVVLLGELVGPAVSFSDKCSACQVVAGEIELGLANERPRNNLDMRHRLDSTGKREGKVINYKVSELRVVELLEGLCTKFKSYTFRKGDADVGQWIKVQVENLSDLERQEVDSYSKELTSYCGRLLETTEDELTSKLQKGEVKAGDVGPVLCGELTEHCKQPKTADEDLQMLGQTGIQGGSDGEL